MIELTVGAVETRTPQTITPETAVSTAAELLRRPEIPALPVIEDGSVAGIVTASDIVALVAETEDQPSISAIMSSPVSTIAPGATLLEAANCMQTAGVKHLPIVEDGVYLGLLSADTLAPYLSRHNLDIEWADDPLRVDTAGNGGLTASD